MTVREVTVGMLRDLGYDVFEAGSGGAADAAALVGNREDQIIRKPFVERKLAEKLALHLSSGAVPDRK